MKHISFGVALVAISIAVILVITTISGHSTRKEEIDSTLTLALEQAVENTINQKTYTINDKNEFIKDVLQNLLITYENDSDIEIKIAGADEEKGLISIKAIEHYKNPNGKSGEIVAEKTVIMEKTSDTKYFIETFLNADGTTFMTCRIKKGDKAVYPSTDPGTYNSKNFKNWKYNNINMTKDDIINMTVTENITFTAVY